MRRPLVSVAAAAASTVLLSAGPGAAEGGDAGAANAGSGTDVQVPDSGERIEGYWTPERMRAAKPMEKPMLSREDTPAPAPDPDPVSPE